MHGLADGRQREHYALSRCTTGPDRFKLWVPRRRSGSVAFEFQSIGERPHWNHQRNHLMSDPAILHAEQVAYWNGSGAARWVEWQEAMEASLAPPAEVALAMARGTPGEQGLYAGCGSGAASVALAR